MCFALNCGLCYLAFNVWNLFSGFPLGSGISYLFIPQHTPLMLTHKFIWRLWSICRFYMSPPSHGLGLNYRKRNCWSVCIKLEAVFLRCESLFTFFKYWMSWHAFGYSLLLIAYFLFFLPCGRIPTVTGRFNSKTIKFSHILWENNLLNIWIGFSTQKNSLVETRESAENSTEKGIW